MQLVIYGLLSILLLAKISKSDDALRWNTMAEAELDEALNLKINTKRARNVILFIGDGMGPNTVIATRIHKYGESGHLSFEKFPHVGLLKTYCNDHQVPDSASTATAMFTGVKVNYDTSGVDGSVQLNDCEASLKKEARLTSLVGLAQDAKMSTGFITTMRVTHATPSALYAHTSNRDWECDAKLPEGTQCKDIGRQLIEDEPGRNINVIMGGGRQSLVTNATVTPEDPSDSWTCHRRDGRDLINAWIDDKQNRSLTYAVAQNNEELSQVDTNKVDNFLGIFANGHMKYEHERIKTGAGMPSIVKMTEVGIKILEKNKKGYFLMIEGGNIDMAHHRGKAKIAINEAATMDDAVKRAIEMTDPAETLIVVTSDHTHTLSINGYAKRGSNIFGLSVPSKVDHKNYTRLTYATGGPDSFQYSVTKDEDGNYTVERRDPSQDNITDFDYVSQSTILTDENTHGGGDVIIFAKGPYGHLFHNIHEQHYVKHAISYAAAIGKYIKYRPYKNSSNNLSNSSLIFSIIYSMIYILKTYNS